MKTIHNQDMQDDGQRAEMEAEFMVALLFSMRRIYEDNEPTSEAEAMLLPGALSSSMLTLAPLLKRWLYQGAKLGIETAIDEDNDNIFVDIHRLATATANDRINELIPQLQKTTFNKARQAVYGAAEKGLSLAALYASVGGLYSTHRAKSIATTETTFAFNLALHRLGGIVTGITGQQWIAVMDDRTCAICSALGGTIWLDGAPNLDGSRYSAGELRALGSSFIHPGGTGAQVKFAGRAFKRPPAHTGCRCRIRLVRGHSLLTSPF